MSQPESKVSTSIAIAPALRARLDAAAAEQDRSRSYITAEAIKEYLVRREAMRDDR